MSAKVRVFCLIGTCLLAGCATQNVSNPSNITLAHALVDTADALNAAYLESKRNGRTFGFEGCTITAVFNVSATAGEDNKLSLAAAPPAAIFPVGASAGATFESTASGSRGNTVTVLLATPQCMEKASNSNGGNQAAKKPGNQTGQSGKGKGAQSGGVGGGGGKVIMVRPPDKQY